MPAPGRRTRPDVLGRLEDRRGQAREHLVGRAERLLARAQVVAASRRRCGDRTRRSGLGIWFGPVPIIDWQRTGSVEGPGLCGLQDRRVRLGDLDLLEDERQVGRG